MPGIRVKPVPVENPKRLKFSVKKIAEPNQSPVPGAGEKYFSNLPSIPS